MWECADKALLRPVVIAGLSAASVIEFRFVYCWAIAKSGSEAKAASNLRAFLRFVDIRDRISKLADCLSDPEVGRLLRVANPSGVEHLGEVAGSYAEAICLAGKRQYMSVYGLCRAGVVFPFFGGLDELPALPPVEAITVDQELLVRQIVRAVCELPRPDWGTSLRMVEMECERAAGSLERPTANGEGPAGGYRWRHAGKETNTAMQPAAWKMCSALWDRPERSANFDDLIGPIYGDDEHIADANAFGSLRRAANRFFSDNCIPLAVTIKKVTVFLLAE